MDIKKWIGRVIWIPAMIAAVLFFVANRAPVAISLDPFSTENPFFTTMELPLWFWLMAMLFVGFIAGTIGMWLSARPGRQKAHMARRELKSLRRELDDAHAQLAVYQREAEQAAPKEELPSLEAADSEGSVPEVPAPENESRPANG